MNVKGRDGAFGESAPPYKVTFIIFKPGCTTVIKQGQRIVEDSAVFGRAVVLGFTQIHPNSQGLILSQSMPSMFTEETWGGCHMTFVILQNSVTCSSTLCT